jgi:hypothetical protein
MANLTPELLKLLQGGGNMVNSGGTVLDGSRAFHPVFLNQFTGGGGAEGGDMQSSVTGYQGYDYQGQDADWDDYAGKQRDLYDASGQYTGSDVFQERDPMWQTALTYAAILASAGAAGGALAGAAGGAGAGAGGGMVNGAFLGEGALSGIGAWDGALAGAGAAGAGGGAAADGLLNGLNGSDIMSDAFVQNGGYGAGGFGGSNGGLLSSLTSSLTNGGGGSDWTSLLTKYGPGILGGLVGGKSGSEGSNTQKTMDPRLDPHIFGDKGGFARAYGLLDTPVAPNAFERFYGGR